MKLITLVFALSTLLPGILASSEPSIYDDDFELESFGDAADTSVSTETLSREPRRFFGKYFRLDNKYRLPLCYMSEFTCCLIKCVNPPNIYCANPPGANANYCASTYGGQGIATGMLCRNTKCEPCKTPTNTTCVSSPECSTLQPPTNTPVVPGAQQPYSCPQFLLQPIQDTGK